MSRNDGGPAQRNLTVRDVLAMNASERDIRACLRPWQNEKHPGDRSEGRYRHADKMLAERSKPLIEREKQP